MSSITNGSELAQANKGWQQKAGMIQAIMQEMRSAGVKMLSATTRISTSRHPSAQDNAAFSPTNCLRSA